MDCPNCGTPNLDDAAECAECGRSLAAPSSYTPPPPPPSDFGATPTPPAGAQIPNYLWQSIVATICCCPPLGIVGIIFAAQVNSKIAQGDIAGARAASQKAKMFTLIGVIVGVVVAIIAAVLYGAVMIQVLREAQ